MRRRLLRPTSLGEQGLTAKTLEGVRRPRPALTKVFAKESGRKCPVAPPKLLSGSRSSTVQTLEGRENARPVSTACSQPLPLRFLLRNLGLSLARARLQVDDDDDDNEDFA